MWCGNLEAMRSIRAHSEDAQIWLPWNEVDTVPEELISEIKPLYVNSPYSYWSREKVNAVQMLGVKVTAWTIDDRLTMVWANTIGVDAITTNNLEVLQDLLNSDEATDVLDIPRAAELAIPIGKWAIMVCQMMNPGTVLTKASPADLVTEVDLFIEKHAREMILANFPDHNIVGEEFGGEYLSEVPTWYIDPVDGTTNFANRTPWSSMSLALAVGKEPLVGVTIDPCRNLLFHAIKDGGAFINGAKIVAPEFLESENPLAGRVVLTELAGSRPWDGMQQFLENLHQSFCTMRIMGAGTLTLTAVSANYGVGAVVHKFSRIDHLAAALIGKESGCVVLNRYGQEELFPDSGGLLIVQPHARAALYEIWQPNHS